MPGRGPLLLEEMPQWAWSDAPGSIHTLPSQWHGHSAEAQWRPWSGSSDGILEEAGTVGLWGTERGEKEGAGCGSAISPYPMAERPSEGASKAWRKAKRNTDQFTRAYINKKAGRCLVRERRGQRSPHLWLTSPRSAVLDGTAPGFSPESSNQREGAGRPSSPRRPVSLPRLSSRGESWYQTSRWALPQGPQACEPGEWRERDCPHPSKGMPPAGFPRQPSHTRLSSRKPPTPASVPSKLLGAGMKK